MRWEIKQTIDLAKGISADAFNTAVRPLSYSGDSGAHTWLVTVVKDGEPVSITESISALFIRPDGNTVTQTGSVTDGNTARVYIPQAAYAHEGVVRAIMRATVNTVVTTIGAIAFEVKQSTTGSIIDPGSVVPDLAQLLAEIDNMREATAAAEAAADEAIGNFAPAFSTSTAYTAGQYVTYTDGKLYQFTTDHAAGAWDSADVRAVTTGAELADLNSRMSEDRALLDYDTVISVNKWNPATVLADKSISNNANANYGEVIDGAGYYTTDYIAVNGGDTVSWFFNDSSSASNVVRGSMFRLAEYDANKVVISVTANWPSAPFTTNTNTRFVRIVVSRDYALNMIVLNTTATSYIYGAYSAATDFGRIVPLERSAKILELQASVNKWDDNDELIDKGISTVSTTLGEIVDATGYTTSGLIPALKGQTFSHYYSENTAQMAIGAYAYRIAEYDENAACLLVTANWPTLPYTVQNDSTRFVRMQIYGTHTYNMVIVNDHNIRQKPFIPFLADYSILATLSQTINPAEVILPSAIYGVTGQEINIYKENLVLNNRLKSLAYIHTRLSDAVQDDFRTIWNPSATSLTETNRTWEIMRYGLTTFESRTIKECTVPKDTGSSDIKVLVIGDSKVDSGYVTYYLHQNFDDDDMSITLLGSKYDWAEWNRHEGWGSRTAKWFCTDVESPLSNNGECDFAHYLTSYNIATPDYVFINLGTNDCAGMGGGDDIFLTEFVTYISQMITSIHDVDSNIVVVVGMCEGVATVLDVNNSEFDKWDLNQKISRLHKATIAAFDNRQAENIYVCPMYMGMDLTEDYNMEEVPLSKRDGDVNNGQGDGKTRMRITDRVHQNNVGYWKNADYMYALLKYIVAKSLT